MHMIIIMLSDESVVSNGNSHVGWYCIHCIPFTPAI